MLTATHWTTLEAMINRIVPVDEFPCGWSAGVGDYLARQFGGDLSDCVALYAAGLSALDQEAEALGNTRFAVLPPVAQDSLLANVESGAVASEWPVDPKRFFNMVVGHAMEGYYADPGNGGNREGVSWRMIGFEVTA